MSLAEDEKTFQNKFDQLQGDIELVSVCDELIAGKSKIEIFMHIKELNDYRNAWKSQGTNFTRCSLSSDFL